MNKKQNDYEKLIRARNKMMEEHGWVVDAVFDTENSKCETGTGVDIHTHGLEESFGHMDLQCTLPADMEMIHSIFCIIVKNIKEGKKYEHGKCYKILDNGYKFRFIKTTQGNREVLRIIFPDKHGKLHKSLMEEKFKIQYCGIM